MPPRQKILDAGAGWCQYKPIFTHRHEYIAQDLCIGDKGWDHSHIDIRSPIDSIAEKSSSFDFVMLTQVLVHVPNPQAVLNELTRLLMPGGRILCTVPQSAGEHQIPFHFYNYTRYGLVYLGKQVGLELVSMSPQAWYFTYMGQMLQKAPFLLFWRHLFFQVIFYPYQIIVCLLGLVFDQFEMKKRTTAGYLAIIEKSLKENNLWKNTEL